MGPILGTALYYSVGTDVESVGTDVESVALSYYLPWFRPGTLYGQDVSLCVLCVVVVPSKSLDVAEEVPTGADLVPPIDSQE
jgi:hypothetical protein